MYNYILFKNVRGTTKLNLQLTKPLDSLADLTDRQATIINYVTKVNNYNFTLASELDTSAITLDEMSINIDYIFSVVNA
jgi:hypothetical protein